MKKQIIAFYNKLVDQAVNQTRLEALAQDVRDMQAIADPVERAVKIHTALRDKTLPSEQLGSVMNEKTSRSISKFLAPASLVMACVGIASLFISIPAIIILPTLVLAAGCLFGPAKFHGDVASHFQPHYEALQKEVSNVSSGSNIEELEKSAHFAAAVKAFPNVKYAFTQNAVKRALESLEPQAQTTPVASKPIRVL